MYPRFVITYFTYRKICLAYQHLILIHYQNFQDSLSTPTSKPPSVKSRDSLGRVLSSTEGTPVLRSSSGHSRLPPPENFSKDICDVINFENLPESTGKFERMRGLLKKVKEVLGSQRQSI